MSDSQLKYVLTERIAQGGMAEIHLGKSIGADGFARVCAFKRILPQFATDAEFIQMFRNEAMVAKQLQNKNIVQVLDFVGDGESFMLVMEYVDGQDVRAVLGASEQQKKRIPLELACYIILESLAGLSYAHLATDMSGRSMGIIHRDVSPQNILVSYEGDVKITDFGIAKVQNETSSTRAGVLKGKFSYMSPEQAAGEPVDSRADLFALGIVFYEMLTMTRLFKGEDMAVLNAVRECKIRRPNEVNNTEIPPELESILMKMLEKRPDSRYQIAREIVKDLSRFLYGHRPDFFSGELSDFMQSIFQEKIMQAKARVRSTLALPDSAMAIAAMREIGVGHQQTYSKASGGDESGRGVSRLFGTGLKHHNPVPRSSPSPIQIKEPAPLEVAGGIGRKTASVAKTFTPQGAKAKLGNFTPQPQRAQQFQKNVGRNTFTNAKQKRPQPSFVRNFIVGMMIVSALALFSIFTIKSDMLGFTSDVEMIVNPSGRVKVEVNGDKAFAGNYQSTPIKLKLGAGTHVVEVSRPGYKTEKLNVVVSMFGPQKRELVIMKPVSTMGQIKIRTSPAGAKISLNNGQDVGVSPHTFENVVLGRPAEFIISHPRCGTQVWRETLPMSAERQLISRNIQLKNCH